MIQRLDLDEEQLQVVGVCDAGLEPPPTAPSRGLPHTTGSTGGADYHGLWPWSLISSAFNNLARRASVTSTVAFDASANRLRQLGSRHRLPRRAGEDARSCCPEAVL